MIRRANMNYVDFGIGRQLVERTIGAPKFQRRSRGFRTLRGASENASQRNIQPAKSIDVGASHKAGADDRSLQLCQAISLVRILKWRGKNQKLTAYGPTGTCIAP